MERHTECSTEGKRRRHFRIWDGGSGREREREKERQRERILMAVAKPRARSGHGFRRCGGRGILSYYRHALLAAGASGEGSHSQAF